MVLKFNAEKTNRQNTTIVSRLLSDSRANLKKKFLIFSNAAQALAETVEYKGNR